jgi:hypothetical protein
VLRRARFALSLPALAAGALAFAPGAAAHGPFGPAKGYVSSVSSVKPNVLGLEARVVGDQLVVRNWSTKRVVIFGPDGRPYLRLDRRGVFANNGFGWKRVSQGTSFGWHDPRVRWVGRQPPELVHRDPDEAHLIRSWRVPGTADGKRFVIRGLLGYAPPPADAKSGRRPLVPTILGAILAVIAAALLVWRRRQLRARRPDGRRAPLAG